MNIKKYINQIKKDEKRNLAFLHLTANECQMSNTASTFLGSKMNQRYYWGGGGKDAITGNSHFTALGFRGIEALLDQSQSAACKMLSAVDVNINVLSGIHAMMAVILCATDPGDTIMSVTLEAGGHFATKDIIERSGRKHVFADYDFNLLQFDVNKIKQKFKKLNIRAFYIDIAYCLNPVNLREIRSAIGNKPIIIYDASHTLGLIMGHKFQNPFLEGADIICGNTHKTLPGPHKGIIAFKNADLAQKANTMINKFIYSTPHTDHLVALAITILEIKEHGNAFAKQTILNSNAIGKAFEDLGYEVKKANTGNFSENHQCHVFIDIKGNFRSFYKRLTDNNISTNFEGSQFHNGRWYIRIGTSEVTRRGMKEKEMVEIARLMDSALKNKNVRKEVIFLNERFPEIYYSFDKHAHTLKLKANWLSQFLKRFSTNT